MAGYVVTISPVAQDHLRALDTVTRKRLCKKLTYFIDSGRPLSFATQLVNVEPPTYRFRIGKYRVFFEADAHTINILDVKRRDQAYRKI